MSRPLRPWPWWPPFSWPEEDVLLSEERWPFSPLWPLPDDPEDPEGVSEYGSSSDDPESGRPKRLRGSELWRTPGREDDGVEGMP